MSDTEKDKDETAPTPPPPQAKPRLGPPPMTMREDHIEEIMRVVLGRMRHGAALPPFPSVLNSTRVQETSANRNKEYAEKLLRHELMQENSTREFILIMDWTEIKFVTQSNASYYLFGDLLITPFQRLMTRECDVKAVVTCGGAAILNPGREFKISAHLQCTDEECLFYLSFVMDPASYFLVLTGCKT